MRHPEVLWRTSLDSVVLLPPGDDGPVVVDGPGALVWTLTEQLMTSAEIADALAELYEAPAGEIARDVERLLSDLRERGAVRMLP